MPLISAIVLTFNEEKNLERCLRSLSGLADEVIVVDSFSTDRTIEIAQKAGGRVIQIEWPGYGPAKNYAAEQAKYPVLLFLDADESLSPELRQSILSIKDHLDGVYAFNRLNNYCGTWLRHGGFYPDIKIRMYNKGKATWSHAAVHETVVPSSTEGVRHLRGDIHHYSYTDHDDHRHRADKYARLAASQLISKGKKPGMLTPYIKSLARFIKHFVLRLGFLDGREGFWVAWITCGEVYKKYAIAREGTRHEAEHLNRKK